MDQIYCRRYPRIFRLYHAIPSRLLYRCPSDRLLHWIPQHCTPVMDRRRLLFCAHTHSDSMPCPWFCVEIVRPFPPHAYESWSDLAHSYRRTYRPAPYHIAQELQKYNIPDYRPRQEQYVPSPLLIYLGNFINIALPRFQKAIKKVRAVQRMRRNRGFAFSQTENAGRQDQAKLIRAYDTSKSNARPSGY
jgi:hypothetical protein